MFRSLTNKLDLINMHGNPICHAFGCRKQKHLKAVFGGSFCNQHEKELRAIRDIITYYSTIDNSRKPPFVLAREIQLLEQEAAFRKRLIPGHMNYINLLYSILSFRYSQN